MSHPFTRLTAARRVGGAVVATAVAVGLGLGALGPSAAYADHTADHPGHDLDAAAVTSARVHQRNLLRAASFTAHGYARVQTFDNWEGDGDFELSSCGATPTYDAAGLVNRKFRMYVGAQTRGEQVVLQFETRGDSASYVRAYRSAIQGCAERTGDTVAFSSQHRADVSGATSARWWSTHTDEGASRAWGTVSVVRDGDRVSLLTMYSSTSQPRKVMDVPALMQDMGDRLALA